MSGWSWPAGATLFMMKQLATPTIDAAAPAAITYVMQEILRHIALATPRSKYS